MLTRLNFLLAIFFILPFTLTQAHAAEPQMPTEVISLSPMHFASMNSDRSASMDSSLRLAAREGRAKVVEKLISEGADVNGSGDFGETALSYAARWNHIRVALILLDNRAQVNLTDHNERTALIYAAQGCSGLIAEKLLSHQADPNMTDYDGRNALIYAAMNGCKTIVTQLLKTKNLSLNLPDKNGKTALDYALEGAQLEVGGPYTDCARLILKAGGKTAQFTFITPETLSPASGNIQNKTLP